MKNKRIFAAIMAVSMLSGIFSVQTPVMAREYAPATKVVYDILPLNDNSFTMDIPADLVLNADRTASYLENGIKVYDGNLDSDSKVVVFAQSDWTLKCQDNPDCTIGFGLYEDESDTAVTSWEFSCEDIWDDGTAKNVFGKIDSADSYTALPGTYNGIVIFKAVVAGKDDSIESISTVDSTDSANIMKATCSIIEEHEFTNSYVVDIPALSLDQLQVGRTESFISIKDADISVDRYIVIDAVSDNNWRLVLDDDDDVFINYVINEKEGGEFVSHFEYDFDTVNRGKAGSSIGIEIKEEDFNGKPDGAYSDTITWKIKLEKGISIEGEKEREMQLEDTGEFTINKLSAYKDQDVEWESSNINVISVDKTTGVYEVKGYGTAYITAKAGNIEDKIKVNVENNYVTFYLHITISSDDASIIDNNNDFLSWIYEPHVCERETKWEDYFKTELANIDEKFEVDHVNDTLDIKYKYNDGETDRTLNFRCFGSDSPVLYNDEITAGDYLLVLPMT